MIVFPDTYTIDLYIQNLVLHRIFFGKQSILQITKRIPNKTKGVSYHKIIVAERLKLFIFINYLYYWVIS